MNAATLTPAQARALATLRALPRPYVVQPATATHVAHIVTGVNTGTLANLAARGLVAYSTLYLGGRVSPDFRLVEEETVPQAGQPTGTPQLQAGACS